MALGPIMLDIEGTELVPTDRDLLREPSVGGLILFARNYESPTQIADLIAEVRSLRTPPLLIAVDHEGGRVQRFRDGFSSIPPMRQVGRGYDRDPEAALELAEQIGWLLAAELLAIGVDLSFSPCLDLDWGVNSAIGDRAFHRRPDVVAALAMRYCRGMSRAGMAAVGKHFPGHGAVAADSHERLPVDRREFGDILDDMRPYETLLEHRQLPAIMLSHVVYAEADSRPASLSPFWITRQLRNELRFDGAIFTDDMSMKATSEFGSMPKRAAAALEAGCDMVVICNDRTAAARAVAALRDYSNPPSLVRLARLHGTHTSSLADLQASDDWQRATGLVSDAMARPVLELDA